MKTFVALSVLAACIVASISSPAPRLVDWTAVTAKAQELEDAVYNAGKEVVDMATNANAMVGNAVQMKVQVAYMEASLVSGRLNQAIEDQTLTEEEATGMGGELRGIMGKLMGSIQRDIAMLPPMQANQIRAVFTRTFDAVNMAAEEMSALLSQ